MIAATAFGVLIMACHPTQGGEVATQLRDAYIYAKNDFPKALDHYDSGLRTVQDALRSESAVVRCGANYWAALRAPTPGPHVRKMVRTALLSGNGKTFETDALGALPEALAIIVRLRGAVDAVDAVITLRLDGGPGETLSGRRCDLFLRSPLTFSKRLALMVPTVSLLSSHAKTKDYLVDLATHAREDQGFRRNLEVVTAKHAGRSEAEYRYLAELIREILEPKPMSASQQAHGGPKR